MNKFDTLFNQILSEQDYDASQFDPRKNVADYSNRRKEDYREPKDVTRRRDPETPDYTKATGMYAIEGPNPEKPGGLGYWDVMTGEFLYSKYDAPSSGVHKTSNKEAAHTKAKELAETHKDLSQEFRSRNRAWAKEDYNPFKVVQFYKK